MFKVVLLIVIHNPPINNNIEQLCKKNAFLKIQKIFLRVDTGYVKKN